MILKSQSNYGKEWPIKNKGKEPPVFLSTHPSSATENRKFKNWISEVMIKYPPIKFDFW